MTKLTGSLKLVSLTIFFLFLYLLTCSQTNLVKGIVRDEQTLKPTLNLVLWKI